VDREHQVMKALEATDVPVPRMLHLCEDISVIGTKFYVMEMIEGRVFTETGLPGFTPAERNSIYREMIEVLAKLHAVDYRDVGLDDFGRPGNYCARQISRWSRQYMASKTEDIPEMERLAFLVTNVQGSDCSPNETTTATSTT
jgi:aminoglycoside phosphotransferase (APT) family kinase protein